MQTIQETERIFTPVIELQASWLAINPIQGCPKNCQYCFLKRLNQTGVLPKQILDFDQTLQELISYKYYHPEIPICFFTHTDPLATPGNRAALLDLLKKCHQLKLPNIKCFISKCPFPEDFVKELYELQQKGEKILVYVSFSGLNGDIEKGINHAKLYSSLEFLRKYEIPMIHYWRPFIPANSSHEVMLNVIKKMAPFAKASVATGLKLYPEMIKQINFWPSLEFHLEKTLKAESVWPQGVLYFLHHLPEPYNKHPIYLSNSCAISYVMNKSDLGGFFDSPACRQHNSCPEEKRSKCQKFYSNFNNSQKLILESMSKLNIDIKFVKLDSTEKKLKIIISEEIPLTIQDIVYLRHAVKADVIATRKDSYWRSSTTGDEPIELE